MSPLKSVGKKITAVFAISANLSLATVPAVAQDAALTNKAHEFPSQLGINLKALEDDNIQACLQDFDRQLTNVVAFVNSRTDAERAALGFHDRINSALGSITGYGPDDVTCKRWIAYKNPSQWPSDGCLVKRYWSPFGFDMSLDMRYDLSTGVDFRIAFLDGNKELWGADRKIIYSGSRKVPAGATIAEPDRADVEKLQIRLRSLPDLCSPGA